MEKLLILGNNYHVDCLIHQAKERNIYTIVADYLPKSESPVKLLADESWDISVTDYDALEEMAKKSGVTGVVCGAGELCMATCRELSKRLGFPFYVPDKAWEITNDKQAFKKTCRKHGLPVAEDYLAEGDSLEDALQRIAYPVVVKPVDGCSSLGMHICQNEQELRFGYQDALLHSPSKRVVVEKFCQGVQIFLLIMFEDGEAQLIESIESMRSSTDSLPFIFGMVPSLQLEKYKNKLMQPLQALFRDLGCESGAGSVQAIAGEDEITIIEMNYRLPGGRMSPLTQERLCLNVLRSVFPNVIGKVEEKKNIVNAKVYVIWLNPGRISKIDGIDEIMGRYANLVVTSEKKLGDTILPNSGMRQIFGYMYVVETEEGKEALWTFVETVNEYLVILDENGNDMVRRYDYIDGQAVLRG